MKIHVFSSAIAKMILASVIFIVAMLLPAISQTVFAAENLIPNSSLEAKGGDGNPVSWHKGKWGTNTAVFTYPVSGSGGGSAARVEVSNYQSGDAKWYFDDVGVAGGVEMELSGEFLSNTKGVIVARYRTSQGFIYKDLAVTGPTPWWQPYSLKFVIPEGVSSMTIFHVLNRNGVLDIDNMKLSVAEKTEPPSVSGNLVKNFSFEEMDSNRNPLYWNEGKWGTHTTTFRYPVAGNGSERAARVEVSNYQSGDSKWYFDDVAVQAGKMYELRGEYKSNADMYLTARYTTSGGGFIYKDLARLSPSSSWENYSIDFTVPDGVVAMTVFHLLNRNGILDVDNTSLVLKGSTPAPNGGFVSLTFDDGWISIYENAIPILRNAGIKSTQYIITGRFSFPSYVDQAQVVSMHNEGHEIGAHSITHRDLTSLSLSEIRNEIFGSRADLQELGINATTFAYPFGAYNSTVQGIIAEAGYSAARSSDGGINSSTDLPRFALRRRGVNSDISLSQVISWIEEARRDEVWLILAFHRIDDSGTFYSTTPETLQGIADYIKANNVPIKTVQEGITLFSN